jgi:membrane protease YdiL (CAAX protease family)
MWWLPTTAFASWQYKRVHWNYAFQLLFFIIPLVAFVIGRRRPADYGLVLTEPRLHLRLAVMLVILLVLVPLASQALFGRLELNRTFAAYPISTIIFHFVFSSFGEELFFRGFMQGELNLAFGRPWRLAGVPFGVGLIVAALVFAIGHGIEQMNPLLGSFELDPQAFLATAAFAIVAGLLRERTGSLLAPTLLHATIDLNWHLLRLDPVLRKVQPVCTAAAFVIIFAWILRRPSDVRSVRAASGS